MEENLGKRLLAEAIGVFGLVYVGAGAILADAASGGGVGLVGIALAHGLVLAIMISAVGHVSGGHINPAVTAGFLVTGRMRVGTALAYVVAQLLGAVAAGLLLTASFPAAVREAALLGTPVLGEGVGTGRGILVEAVLSFFLVLAVFGTAADPKGPRQLAGFGIGTVLIFDILAGGPLTGAAMNPARVFGPALVGGVWSGHLVYWVGPLLGGILAAVVYQGLLQEHEAKTPPRPGLR